MTGSPPPPPQDSGDWLFRLTRDEWLLAAENELSLCLAKLQQRSARAAVTHARRAAGMAWNAILTMHQDPRYGRSYMDHVRAAALDLNLPEAIRAAANRLLRDPATVASPLIRIGKPPTEKPDLSIHLAACALVSYARAQAGTAGPTSADGRIMTN